MSENEVSENEVAAQSFSTRQAPWMKIGALVDEPVTAAEAAKLANLDFTVRLDPVGSMGPDGQWRPIGHRKAVIAEDNGDFMGFVSNGVYNTLQYGEAFSFMDEVSPRYVAAGSLRGRRQGFMVVKPDVDFKVLGGDDPHELFCVLRTSHDCSRATEISVMPLRGKCMNQLSLRTFSAGAQQRWSIKHTPTQAAKLAEARNALVRVNKYAKRYVELVDRMAACSVSQDQARKTLEIIIPAPRNAKTEKAEEKWRGRIESIMTLWETSPTVGYAGTGWGLVNAVSEYFDWLRVGGTPESRFIGALEGVTHKKINQAAGLILSGSH